MYGNREIRVNNYGDNAVYDGNKNARLKPRHTALPYESRESRARGTRETRSDLHQSLFTGFVVRRMREHAYVRFCEEETVSSEITSANCSHRFFRVAFSLADKHGCAHIRAHIRTHTLVLVESDIVLPASLPDQCALINAISRGKIATTAPMQLLFLKFDLLPTVTPRTCTFECARQVHRRRAVCLSRESNEFCVTSF